MLEFFVNCRKLGKIRYLANFKATSKVRHMIGIFKSDLTIYFNEKRLGEKEREIERKSREKDTYI